MDRFNWILGANLTYCLTMDYPIGITLSQRILTADDGPTRGRMAGGRVVRKRMDVIATARRADFIRPENETIENRNPCSDQ